ncbi:hypothetical protein SpCBS45565_g02878 [Spizellomyces sp. 'palustris']|nr:hypothetical protein SpCBS45565_g02878 [Spizellomyces sp. 'palustris']
MSTTDDSKRSKRLETVGNKDTMNLHNILYQNIISSPYFKSLYEKKTYHEVIDEIYNQVSSLGEYLEAPRRHLAGLAVGYRAAFPKQPFFKGTHASTAFCLLYKLWTLKLTVKQVQGLITHTDSAHIRALGFMYLRYVCKPSDLWGWYEPYLDDDEELQVEAGAKPRTMSMGRFLRELLTDNKWIGTMLPRIPVPVARDIEKKLKENPPAHGATTDALAGQTVNIYLIGLAGTIRLVMGLLVASGPKLIRHVGTETPVGKEVQGGPMGMKNIPTDVNIRHAGIIAPVKDEAAARGRIQKEIDTVMSDTTDIESLDMRKAEITDESSTAMAILEATGGETL